MGEWSRLNSAKDVTALVGVWKNSDNLMCTVANGECNFHPRGSPTLVVKDGVLSLNGWVAVAITSKAVSWQRSGQSMQWQRIVRGEDIPGLNGSWKTSDGLICNVKSGTCTFHDPPGQGQSVANCPVKGSVALAMRDGLPVLNAWRAVAIRAQGVSWRKGDKSLEWSRFASTA